MVKVTVTINFILISGYYLKYLVFDLAKLDQLACQWPWGVGKKCIACGFSNSEVNVTITTMYIYIYIYIYTYF